MADIEDRLKVEEQVKMSIVDTEKALDAATVKFENAKLPEDKKFFEDQMKHLREEKKLYLKTLMSHQEKRLNISTPIINYFDQGQYRKAIHQLWSRQPLEMGIASASLITFGYAKVYCPIRHAMYILLLICYSGIKIPYTTVQMSVRNAIGAGLTDPRVVLGVGFTAIVCRIIDKYYLRN